MKKIRLDDANFHVAAQFITEQMETQSWWPREQPHLAKEEFLRMKESPETLNAWCDKWLYSGQKRQLEKHIERVAAKAPEGEVPKERTEIPRSG